MATLITTLNIVWILFLIFLINRQILGWGVYSTFWPLFFSYLFLGDLINPMILGIILVVSYLSRELSLFLTQSFHASQFFKNIFTLWITLLFLTLLWYLFDLTILADMIGLSAYELTITTSFYFVWLVTIIVWIMTKIYAYWKDKKFKTRFSYTLWFFIISILGSLLLRSIPLYAFVENNIVITFVITLFLILIWSYKWLQLKEIVRFHKLIFNRSKNK